MDKTFQEIETFLIRNRCVHRLNEAKNATARMPSLAHQLTYERGEDRILWNNVSLRPAEVVERKTVEGLISHTLRKIPKGTTDQIMAPDEDAIMFCSFSGQYLRVDGDKIL